MTDMAPVIGELQGVFGGEGITPIETADHIPTASISQDKLKGVLRYLKGEVERPYEMLYDLTAIDERARVRSPAHRMAHPDSDFTVVYHLISFGRNEDIRLKVPIKGEYPTIDSIVDIWPAANWYEREVWDMFGIVFEGHPLLRRILMPDYWKGHPLRKDHVARATDMEPFSLPDEIEVLRQQELQFRPEEWRLKKNLRDTDVMFLNLGPQHPGTHGLLRVILELDGEEIVESTLDIGYHHRGAEKMGERQSWHTYIPYTDRIDYLGGVMNNLAYVLSVEKLSGIEVPDRAKVIRIMLSELFRIASHLVWYGTFAQDVGALSPVFYMFTDRERVFDIIAAICGGRMHPNWFRIGGVAQDLPRGWDSLIKDFLDYMPARLAEYDRIVMGNQIFKARTQGIGCYSKEEALEWGITGPGLRACGLQWDVRKKRPYAGYDQFEFDIPTATNGDCYDRGSVRIEEMRQSLRIVRQCLDNMPDGPYKALHPLATPPLKDRTMHDIETLIDHFMGVSWGPVIPPGEASVGVEATKGINSYYLISDGSTMPYRVRIRAPSFPHLQMVPLICRGLMIPDLMAILGSIDFVLADVDR
jgi:NADH-quinone oxidoreductase subunit C/D